MSENCKNKFQSERNKEEQEGASNNNGKYGNFL